LPYEKTLGGGVSLADLNKARQEQAAQCCKPEDGARIGNYATAKAYRPGIRERIDQAMTASYQANERAFIANEISSILDKNPDFARLLDLLDRF
jgi:hypothetical protein